MRTTYYPIVNKDLWEFYETMCSAYWTPKEIEFEKDIEDFKKIDNDTKKLIAFIFAFFVKADDVIIENLMSNFLNDVQIKEAQAFFQQQVANENVHSVVYSKMAYLLFWEDKLFESIESSVSESNSIQMKIDYAKKWLDPKIHFSNRLLAYILVEGLCFQSLFAEIYLITKGGILPGFSMSNEFIARDENLHCSFGIHLYNKYNVNRLSCKEVHQMIKEVMLIEEAFIDESLEGNKKIKKEEVLQYTKFIADQILTQLDYYTIYNVENPFPYMTRLNLRKKVNFFEVQNTNYIKADLSKISYEDLKFF